MSAARGNWNQGLINRVKGYLAKAQTISQNFIRTGKLWYKAMLALSFALTVLTLVFWWTSTDGTRVVRPGEETRYAYALAHVEVEYILRVENLDYSLRYNANARLNNVVIQTVPLSPSGKAMVGAPISELRGTGEGDYDERSVSTAPSDYCTVTREGKVTMQVTVHPDINAVDAKIIGPVERKVSGKPECDANVKKGNITDVTCGFENVDLKNGGTYHGSADEPRSGEAPDVYQRTCTLDFAPSSLLKNPFLLQL
jgi:hypothetical protein